jgi:hypothetical protein
MHACIHASRAIEMKALSPSLSLSHTKHTQGNIEKRDL